ncbi:glycosyltransferase family protein [Yinghuangia seranimata]|uniref:glycosyltransferase family protein n=1 Tax=Yinghuangia seranimata TaxID=408067 RepID=UPI00248B13C9|nr:glycosyltransferase [Yinghuangia seranimata]MDI2132261.1 glycosyltransferase [Yinghuangia seranimata]
MTETSAAADTRAAQTESDVPFLPVPHPAPLLEVPPPAPPVAGRCDVSIISSGHDLADARLHRTAAALLRAGLTVEAIGLGDPVAAPAGVRVVALGPRGGALARARRDLAVPLRARGRVLVTLDPDLVPVAAAVRLLRRGRLVVDVHEDYAKLLRDRPWGASWKGRLGRALVRLCTAVSRRADVTVVADDHVPPLTARRRLVVKNLPDRGYLPEPGEPDAVPRAVYIGDVRRSRGLATMLAAIESAAPWELDIVGPVAAADRAWLDDWRAGSPAADRVRLHGRQAPGEAWRIARGAWTGFALLHDTPAFREAVPTKLYEYLGSGLAVLATPLPRMARIVHESGAGRVVRDAEDAGRILRAWADRPEELRALRTAAVAWSVGNLAGASPSDELARTTGDLVRAATRSS